VEQEIDSGVLREVKVKELVCERKIRLVYPARRALSHAARAFLELVDREAADALVQSLAEPQPLVNLANR
jgi:DNA-binding transcriptional LysR family regulator